jgi:hypothetical protein
MLADQESAGAHSDGGAVAEGEALRSAARQERDVIGQVEHLVSSSTTSGRGALAAIAAAGRADLADVVVGPSKPAGHSSTPGGTISSSSCRSSRRSMGT